MTATTDICSAILQTAAHAGCRQPLVICGHSFMKNPAYDQLLHTSALSAVPFHDYEPNPRYESVLNGLQLFQDRHCDMLISIGGGSPIDVAKSIKAFYNMKTDLPYIKQSIIPNAIPHLAIPTTAGTGSEATHFAVIYYQGKKYSIADTSLTPDYVVMDPELLTGLPAYQRKATMLDALGHAIESFWSVHATEESRNFAAAALQKWFAAYPAYLKNTAGGNAAMLKAAHLAGKAIDMTTTTAAHAMSYKMTSLYGIAHGHAVGLCLPALWKYMLTHMDQVTDPRGADYTITGFQKIARHLGQPSLEAAILFLRTLLKKLDMTVPQLQSADELELLCASVNLQRLSNNPVALRSHDLHVIYQNMLSRT